MRKTNFDCHIENGKDEWLTPPSILERLGAFDLDPCAPISRPWNTARLHYTIADNGLSKQWLGRVWCNPPYGSETCKWVNKCADHGNAIVLIFARTETKTFFTGIWGRASGMLFVKGRIYFYNSNGQQAQYSGGAPSVLIAFGAENAAILRSSGIAGAWVGATEILEGVALQPTTQQGRLEDSTKICPHHRYECCDDGDWRHTCIVEGKLLPC